MWLVVCFSAFPILEQGSAICVVIICHLGSPINKKDPGHCRIDRIAWGQVKARGVAPLTAVVFSGCQPGDAVCCPSCAHSLLGFVFRYWFNFAGGAGPQCRFAPVTDRILLGLGEPAAFAFGRPYQ